MMRVLQLLTIGLACSGVADARDRLPAFPGAEGFGAFARGGRGGRVLLVTDLRDYRPGKETTIPGTLRAACEAKGPRIVVFRTSGTIRLRDALRIREPFLTLAGQTAPGGGVCVRDHGCSITTHDVIVQHLRFRPGDALRRECDALSLGSGARDVIIDHCSTSWAIDEVLSVSGAGITNVTVQWTVISESLNDSYHGKGKHGYGSLLRTNGNVTFHHCLYAFHSSRSPRPGTYGEGSILLDFRNNVIHRGGRGYTAKDPARINYVGNWIQQTEPFVATDTTVMHAAGNRLEGSNAGVENPWDLIRGLPLSGRRAEPFPVAAVATDTAARAYERVLTGVGAALPRRDAVDVRVIALVRSGRGRLIDSQGEVGGWPRLDPAVAPRDNDRDGMPDAWEKAHGLDPRDSGDASTDADRDGYSNVEEFIHRTDPQEAT